MLRIRAQVWPFPPGSPRNNALKRCLLLVWWPISKDNLCHYVLHGSLLCLLAAAAFKGGGQAIHTRALNTGGVNTVLAKETAVFWGSQGCGDQFSWAPSCSVFLRLFILGFFLALFFVPVSALVLRLALPILKHLPGGWQTALPPSYMHTFSL